MRNLSGFDIVEISKGVWVLENEDGESIGGTFKEIAYFVVLHFGIKISELDSAIGYMLKHNHNAARFGVFGDFMYSFNQNVIPDRLAS